MIPIDYTKKATPKEFLDAELKMGISFDNEAFVNLTRETAQQFKDLDIKSVLDYGAGTGVYAEAYRKEGYDTYAYEIWEEHKNYIRENAPLVKIVSQPITTDLMNFIEVAEHMTDTEIRAVFRTIKPKYVLFSSTSKRTDWDYAWGHINVKEQGEWIEFFNTLDYKLLRQVDKPTPYTKLFYYESSKIIN